MRIAVVSAQVFPCPPAGYSGLEMVAWQLARGLVKRGHQVTLIAPNGSHLEGGNVIPTGEPGKFDEKTAYSQYWQYLPNFDAIIDHSWQKWSYVLKEEGKLKAPVLGVLHAPVDSMFKEPPSAEKPCFVCISQDQAAHFRALFSRDARVAYNGIDLNYYKPISLPRNGRFLFLARFSQIKGPHIAINTCLQLKAGLDLVGDTSITQEPDYLKRCQKLCDGKSIKFVGAATRGGCVWWMSKAHVLLHPNKEFREPFGLAPVEAQACGLPVVCWDNGAMRETVKNGETGFVIKSEAEFTRATNSFLNDHPMDHPAWKTVRARCREWASQFSVEIMAARYEELCVEALETGGW